MVLDQEAPGHPLLTLLSPLSPLIALPLVAVRAAQDIDTLDPHITNRKDIGNVIPLVRNQHVSSFICIALSILLVLTGTWIYLWQLLGGANQLMAALSLLLVTVWLASVGKNWLYAGLPMIFMYVTTMASLVVTAYNLYFNVYQPNLAAGRTLESDHEI